MAARCPTPHGDPFLHACRPPTPPATFLHPQPHIEEGRAAGLLACDAALHACKCRCFRHEAASCMPCLFNRSDTKLHPAPLDSFPDQVPCGTYKQFMWCEVHAPIHC